MTMTKPGTMSAGRILGGLRSRTATSLRGPNEWLGRRVFGNTNTLTMNLNGVWDEKRAAGGLFRGKPRNADAKALRHDGCVILSKRIPDATMASLRAEYDAAVNDPECYKVDDKYKTATGDVRRTISNARRFMPSIEGVLTDEIKDVIEAYYGGGFQVVRVEAYRNKHVPDEVAEKGIYANLWHCDARRPSLIKLMLNINDVGDDGGPLQLLTVSRTRQMLKMGYKTRYEYGACTDVIDDPDHVVALVGSSGTAMLCNTDRCLHKAGVPAKGRHRDLLSMLFGPSALPLPPNWMDEPDRDIR